MRNEQQLIVKVAVLYYKYDMHQAVIAKKLGLSRQKIGRLLKQAKDEGIVKITIQSDLSYASECAATLERLFSLKEAIVVDVPVYEDQIIKEELGKAAADLLERILENDDSLSISWSSTVYQSVRHMEKLPLTGLRFSQLNGSHERVPFTYSGLNILNLLNQKIPHSRTFPLLAPMKLYSEELLVSLLKDNTIKEAMQAASESRIALFGVGSISQDSSLFHAGYMDNELVETLQAVGAVADVCGHFIDQYGKLCSPETERRILSISETHLKRKEYSIALAGNIQKAEAIHGALKGGWCNVLITDLQTAEQLVAMEQTGE
ncbi:MAG: sugar-binding transcriptional regulator [Sphaerochaeta sp.]